ncbi:hypothetical protein UNDKW_3651 [Undibacterium sp. KW1]|uniref:hypothetical protein n=1 Tax=Undibacterium sp. KW1 TaxID=2058624 RepID=UPI001331DAB8|nr:hypothetical protein [Undibacterium sp. KW1]BBB61924.1 hypothetical protein UNDKW_3651 [Undibacterium sp. KW1]
MLPVMGCTFQYKEVEVTVGEQQQLQVYQEAMVVSRPVAVVVPIRYAAMVETA